MFAETTLHDASTRVVRAVAEGLEAMSDSLLERILKDEFDAQELPFEEIPAAMTKLATAFTGIMTRLMVEQRTHETCEIKLLTVSDAAQTLTVSPRTVRKLARQNKLVGFQRTKGGPWYFQPSAINEYMQEETGVTACVAPSQSHSRKQARRRPVSQKSLRRISQRADRAVERIQMEAQQRGPVVPFDYSRLQTEDDS